VAMGQDSPAKHGIALTLLFVSRVDICNLMHPVPWGDKSFVARPLVQYLVLRESSIVVFHLRLLSLMLLATSIALFQIGRARPNS
jgi:hypothetical protein